MGGVAAEALIYGFDLLEHVLPIGPPLIGPTFDLEDPDEAYLLSDALTGTIGYGYKEETIPTSWLVYSSVGMLAGLNGVEALRGQKDWRAFHDLSLGLSASVFTTVTVTEILKRSFGRLRPDFRDRFVARGCQGALAVDVDALPCEDVPPALENISEKEYDYGRRSFPSGHASSSFALGTFASLYFIDLGRTLYAQHKPTYAYLSWGTAVSALGLARLWRRRLEDHRHHLTDVIAGH